MGKNKTVSSKIRYETNMSILPTLIQYSAGIPSQRSKTGERNTRYSNREGRSQIISDYRGYDLIPERP
jgi:hypothetical protein